MTGADAGALNAALLAAHAAGDRVAIMQAYGRAADAARKAGDADRECFFLTHAYVWALDAGHGDAGAYRARLAAQGREEVDRAGR